MWITCASGCDSKRDSKSDVIINDCKCVQGICLNYFCWSFFPATCWKKKRNVPRPSSSTAAYHPLPPWSHLFLASWSTFHISSDPEASGKYGYFPKITKKWDPCFLPPAKAKAWTFRENLENPLASGCVEKEASDRLPGRRLIAGEVPSGAEKDINVDMIWVECMTNLNTWWTTIKCSLKNTSLAKHCQYARSTWHFYNGRVNVLSS